MSDLVRVHTALTLAEAYLVRDVLRGAGVPAVVRGEHLTGAVGGLAADVMGVEVWVARDRVSDAQAVLAEGEARDPRGRLSVGGPTEGGLSAPENARCPACGAEWEPGFEVCWSCEHELDA